MKKFILSLFACGAVLFLSGCVTSTVEIVRDYPSDSVSESGKKIVAEIEGTNYTSFLFGVLPIVSGSHTRPNAWQYSMWRDNVSNRKTRSMMNWYATRVMKADGIENFEFEYDTIGWPTLWIVTWKTAHAKAQVVKNIPAKKTK